MDEKDWLLKYLDRYRESLFKAGVIQEIVQLKNLFLECQLRGRKVILAGNGGSAAIASHCAVDFTKNAGVRCVNFNEADLITCLANDYGYAHWLKKALDLYADDGDMVVLISSSGRSQNMLEAGHSAVVRRLPLVTFTGFESENPLKQMGELNFWVNSRAYNVVEMTHHVWLLAVCDLIIGSAEYPARKELEGVLDR